MSSRYISIQREKEYLHRPGDVVTSTSSVADNLASERIPLDSLEIRSDETFTLRFDGVCRVYRETRHRFEGNIVRIS